MEGWRLVQNPKPNLDPDSKPQSLNPEACILLPKPLKREF